MKKFLTLILLACASFTRFAIDPIAGPSSCCAGSGATLSVKGNPGGAWSSSNPAVAIVDASTGVVTGVSAGTATITYTLGTEYTTTLFTVHTGAGSIIGTDRVTMGHNTTLSNPAAKDAIHSWSSCDPLIASINVATGVVTGVSKGSTIITCYVKACDGIAFTTARMNVTPTDCISGHLLFGGGFTGQVKVSLVYHDPRTGDVKAVDSAIYTSTDSSVFYQFTDIPTDSFRVKASLLDTITYRYGFVTTYYPSNYYWFNGAIIHHNKGMEDNDKDITMIYGRFEH